MTPNDRIARALRLLKVTAAGEAIDAGIAADCLEILNAMLAEWDSAGFGFTGTPYTTIADAIVIPEEDWEAVSANLALRIAPEFEIAEAPPTVIAMAKDLLARLRARYFKPAY